MSSAPERPRYRYSRRQHGSADMLWAFSGFALVAALSTGCVRSHGEGTGSCAAESAPTTQQRPTAVSVHVAGEFGSLDVPSGWSMAEYTDTSRQPYYILAPPAAAPGRIVVRALPAQEFDAQNDILGEWLKRRTSNIRWRGVPRAMRLESLDGVDSSACVEGEDEYGQAAAVCGLIRRDVLVYARWQGGPMHILDGVGGCPALYSVAVSLRILQR